MLQNLNPKLHGLNSSLIKNLKIDLNAERIALTVTPKSVDSVHVEFNGVKTFFYIDIAKDKKYEDTLYTYPMRAISYNQNGFGEFFFVNYAENDFPYAVPNFSISLESSNIYIEADSIDIDGFTFKTIHQKQI